MLNPYCMDRDERKISLRGLRKIFRKAIIRTTIFEIKWFEKPLFEYTIDRKNNPSHIFVLLFKFTVKITIRTMSLQLTLPGMPAALPSPPWRELSAVVFPLKNNHVPTEATLPKMPADLPSPPQRRGSAVVLFLKNNHFLTTTHVTRDACGTSFSSMAKRFRSCFILKR